MVDDLAQLLELIAQLRASLEDAGTSPVCEVPTGDVADIIELLGWLDPDRHDLARPARENPATVKDESLIDAFKEALGADHVEYVGNDPGLMYDHYRERQAAARQKVDSTHTPQREDEPPD